MTPAQKERQRVRYRGRYKKMLACARCSKPIDYINNSAYNHVQDDKDLQAAALFAGLPDLCIVCAGCARSMLISFEAELANRMNPES